MASTNDFQQVLDQFTKRLTRQELDDFRYSSLQDVLLAVEAIQHEQGQRKELMNLPRIQRFLEAMHQYEKIIEVFLNASSFLCFVWGPLKFCLQVASTWAESFDTILDAYNELAENIPLFAEYQTLFDSNIQMRSILAMIYEDILEFHQTALRVLKRPTWKQLFKSTWKDFRTKFQHILDDLSRHKALIESRANLIQINEAQVARALARNKFDAIENVQRKSRHLEVMNWLSAVETILDHEAAISVCREYPSSCRWLLQDNKIRTWMDPNNSLIPSLWMNGIPGAGKTILASFIIEECQKIDNVTVIYFYCSHQDDQRKTYLAIARALLTQLLIQHEDLLAYLHEQCISSGQVSLVSWQQCRQLIETCLETVPRTYIIIDGIDECDFAERKILLTFMSSLASNNGTADRLRTLFISQDENDIRRLLKASTVIRLTDAHNKSDIEVYAAQWSFKVQQKFELPDVTREHILAAVTDGSEGMFLFAKLVLSNLMAQVTREKLYEELRPDTFPKGFEQAYSRIVARVYENSNFGERETAQKLLGWIACSRRSMKWHEIQGAASINIKDYTVDFENRQLRTHVKDICGSLIDIVPGDRVKLVHGTAKFFLEHNDYVKIHDEEQKLATLCLQYLLFDCFDTDLSDDAIKQYTLTGHYGFQDYAIMHWIDHLEASIPYLLSNDAESADNISSVIIDYYKAYRSADDGEEDIPQALISKSKHLTDAKFHKKLLLLVSSTRKLRAKEEKIAGLGDLGEVIAKSRSLLEAIGSSGLSATTNSSLEQYYGKSWYKCPRHACYYFHEGFFDAAHRDSHIARHERPFICTASGCSRNYYGFSTEKELKKHMNTTHPDPAALFPKMKKPPAKHLCDICGKDFTRAHNLKAHKRSHANERPYGCKSCGKAFARKHDKERHVENLHWGERIEDGGGSQEHSLVEPGSSTVEETFT